MLLGSTPSNLTMLEVFKILATCDFPRRQTAFLTMKSDKSSFSRSAPSLRKPIALLRLKLTLKEEGEIGTREHRNLQTWRWVYHTRPQTPVGCVRRSHHIIRSSEEYRSSYPSLPHSKRSRRFPAFKATLKPPWLINRPLCTKIPSKQGSMSSSIGIYRRIPSPRRQLQQQQVYYPAETQERCCTRTPSLLSSSRARKLT